MNNPETNVIFYNKFDGARRVPFIKSPDALHFDHTLTQKCIRELTLAQSCPFGSFGDPSVFSQPNLVKVFYITSLVSISNDLRYQGVPASMLDEQVLHDFGRLLKLDQPKNALSTYGITLKDGEVHVEYRGK